MSSIHLGCKRLRTQYSVQSLYTTLNKLTLNPINTTVQYNKPVTQSNIQCTARTFAAQSTENRPSSRAQAITNSILNVVFLQNKAIGVSMRQIYGIGIHQSNVVCGELGINPFSTPADIGEQKFDYLKRTLESKFQPRHLAVKEQQNDILNKIRIGTYQGIRHQLALPVHGQRTRSNAKTQRKLGRLRASMFGYKILAKKAAEVNKLQLTTKQLQAMKDKK